MFYFIKICDGKNFIQLLVDNVLCFGVNDKKREFVLIVLGKNFIFQIFWMEIDFVLNSYNMLVLFLVMEIVLIRWMNLYEICNYVFEFLSFIYKIVVKGLIWLLIEIGK